MDGTVDVQWREDIRFIPSVFSISHFTVWDLLAESSKTCSTGCFGDLWSFSDSFDQASLDVPNMKKQVHQRISASSSVLPQVKKAEPRMQRNKELRRYAGFRCQKMSEVVLRMSCCVGLF